MYQALYHYFPIFFRRRFAEGFDEFSAPMTISRTLGQKRRLKMGNTDMVRLVCTSIHLDNHYHFDTLPYLSGYGLVLPLRKGLILQAKNLFLNYLTHASCFTKLLL